jgi:hypothetical protein
MGIVNSTREGLAHILWEYDEEYLATKIAHLTDADMQRIGEVAFVYACRTETTMIIKALALAAVEVLEGQPRDLRRKRRRVR